MKLKYTHITKRKVYIEAVNFYNTNEISIKDCAIKFNLDRHNLSRWIRKNGGETNLHGKVKINSKIFSSIDTEEKAYWLGFLYADGYVSDRNEVSLELSLKDKEHLISFNTFIERQREIKIDSFRARCLFKDTNISNDLKSLGVLPRKSLILTFPTYEQVPKRLLRHFIRGYIDGDGSIYISGKNLFISVLGTKEFLIQLIKEIQMPERKLYKKRKDNNSNCWFFMYSGENCKKLIEYLYSNSKIYLERKYNKYLDYCRLK